MTDKIVNPARRSARSFRRKQTAISAVKNASCTSARKRSARPLPRVILTRFNSWMGSAHETEKIVRLGLPRIIRLKENAPELDYSSFYGKTGTGRPSCFVMEVERSSRVHSHSSPRGESSLPYLNFRFVCAPFGGFAGRFLSAVWFTSEFPYSVHFYDARRFPGAFARRQDRG